MLISTQLKFPLTFFWPFRHLTNCFGPLWRLLQTLWPISIVRSYFLKYWLKHQILLLAEYINFLVPMISKPVSEVPLDDKKGMVNEFAAVRSTEFLWCFFDSYLALFRKANPVKWTPTKRTKNLWNCPLISKIWVETSVHSPWSSMTTVKRWKLSGKTMQGTLEKKLTILKYSWKSKPPLMSASKPSY